ncbi:MAG: rhodanese-like domain-containing protein [Bacillus sp. (in: firmicutes)]
MKEISTTEVEALLKEGKTLNLIDVREADEVLERSIPGIIHIPLGSIPNSLHELDQEKEYIMVCRSGARSGRATQFLKSQGFKVTNMNGGMLAWKGEVK